MPYKSVAAKRKTIENIRQYRASAGITKGITNLSNCIRFQVKTVSPGIKSSTRKCPVGWVDIGSAYVGPYIPLSPEKRKQVSE